jgi:GxxExxY protein
MRESSHIWQNETAVNALTEQIISAVIEVHQTLGSGFIESIYRNALVLELRQRGLRVEHEKEVDVFFKGEKVGRQRLDLLVLHFLTNRC